MPKTKKSTRKTSRKSTGKYKVQKTRGKRLKTKKETKKMGKPKPTIEITNKDGVKEVIVNKLFSDEHMAKKEGEYYDESHYRKYRGKNGIITSDCDCYYINDEGKKVLLIRFRKNVLPKNLCKIGMDNLKKAAMKTHDNRGAAAGVLDLKKLPQYAQVPKLQVGKYKFRMKGYYSKYTGKFVNNSLGNLSQSNIIGYYDKPDRNLGIDAPKCRLTAFNAQQFDKWVKVLPLIQAIDRQYKKLVPGPYKKQYQRAHQTEFAIKDTSFSTVTINYNWRTALHKDAGDFMDGFGNLVVLEQGRYKGGCTGFPQFGVAVDVRDGDFLAMDVHEWHCNTKIHPIDKDYARVSIVAYLRERMLEQCKGVKKVEGN